MEGTGFFGYFGDNPVSDHFVVTQGSEGAEGIVVYSFGILVFLEDVLGGSKERLSRLVNY